VSWHLSIDGWLSARLHTGRGKHPARISLKMRTRRAGFDTLTVDAKTCLSDAHRALQFYYGVDSPSDGVPSINHTVELEVKVAP